MRILDTFQSVPKFLSNSLSNSDSFEELLALKLFLEEFDEILIEKLRNVNINVFEILPELREKR